MPGTPFWWTVHHRARPGTTQVNRHSVQRHWGRVWEGPKTGPSLFFTDIFGKVNIHANPAAVIAPAHNRLGGMIAAGVARTGRAVEHLLS